MNKNLKLKLTKNQSRKVVATLLNKGTIELHGYNKHFFNWSIKEEIKSNNLIKRKGLMLVHKIKPTQYFDMWVKARYRENLWYRKNMNQ